jgi:hypothetical protein
MIWPGSGLGLACGYEVAHDAAGTGSDPIHKLPKNWTKLPLTTCFGCAKTLQNPFHSPHSVLLSDDFQRRAIPDSLIHKKPAFRR